MDTSKKPVIIEHEENGFRHFWNSRDVWFNRPVKIGLTILLIVAAVLIGRTIHHHIKNESKGPAVTAPTKPTTAATPANKPGSATKSTPKTSSGTTASGTAGSPEQLTNTGPGDVAAVFALSAILAGGAHYSLKSRRQN